MITLLEMNLLLVSDPINIFYLTGYYAGSLSERETFVLAQFSDLKKSPEVVWQIVPELFWASLPKAAGQLVPKGLKLKTVKLARGQKFTQAAVEILKPLLVQEHLRLLFEADDLHYSETLRLRTGLRQELGDQAKRVAFKPSQGIVENLRSQKSAWELKNIREAVAIAEKSFVQWQKKLKIGVSELETAVLLDKLLLQNGAQASAFKTIVAFAENSAVPHHESGAKKLAKEMPVLVDWGANLNHYNSDHSRSFWFGAKPSQLYLARWEFVRSAYDAAIASLVAKADVKQAIESAERQLGEYKQNFIHSLGHGIGIAVHEEPNFYPKEKHQLPSNSVVTIEPGIYFPGWGGIRLENTVLIKSNGAEVLGQLSFAAKLTPP